MVLHMTKHPLNKKETMTERHGIKIPAFRLPAELLSGVL